MSGRPSVFQPFGFQLFGIRHSKGAATALCVLLTSMPSCYKSHTADDELHGNEAQIGEDGGRGIPDWRRSRRQTDDGAFQGPFGEQIDYEQRDEGAGQGQREDRMGQDRRDERPDDEPYDEGEQPEEGAGPEQPYDDDNEVEDVVVAPACPTVQVRMPNIRPTVILLIDSSFTMQDSFRGTPESRWAVLRNALMNPDTGIVRPVEDRVDFGLFFFGGSIELGCPFETKFSHVLPASNNYTAIGNVYPTEMPAGVSYTATGRALYQVCGSVPTQSVADTRGLGSHYIILASDGNPNGCPQLDFTEAEPPNDFESAELAAQYCVDRGIVIFPLSLADDIDQQHLQTMASIGSNTDHATVYQPEDSEELRQNLADLMGTVSCRIRLQISDGQRQYVIDEDLASCDINGGSVVIGGVSIPCGPNGWLVSDSQHIELQGQACEDFKNSIDPQPTVSFPCEVFVPRRQAQSR